MAFASVGASARARVARFFSALKAIGRISRAGKIATNFHRREAARRFELAQEATRAETRAALYRQGEDSKFHSVTTGHASF